MKPQPLDRIELDRVKGAVEYQPVLDHPLQWIGIALVEYLCGRCPDAHQFVSIRCHDKVSDVHGTLNIQDPIVAQAIVRQLLDSFFGVSPDEWDLAMDMIETRRRLRFMAQSPESGPAPAQA